MVKTFGELREGAQFRMIYGCGSIGAVVWTKRGLFAVKTCGGLSTAFPVKKTERVLVLENDNARTD